MSEDVLLDVRGLSVEFATEEGVVRPVDGLDLQVRRGEVLALVGESGSGKSVSAMTLLGLTRGQNATIGGSADFAGTDLIAASEDELRGIRGNRISMVFQDPMTSFDPVYRIGAQIVEAIRAHRPEVSKAEARTRAIELLDAVGIDDAGQRVDAYPHEFSGGMRQRAMIAMSLVNNPELLIADEPTTALDVTVQAQILDLIRDLQEEYGSAVIMITHDLGVVAELADDILVMYGGRCVERGPADDVFRRPEHPYTWGLLGSMPRLDREVRDRLDPIKGSPPSLINLPSGCAFHPRCPYGDRNGTRSRTETPELIGSVHAVACHLPPEERRQLFTTEIAPNL